MYNICVFWCDWIMTEKKKKKTNKQKQIWQKFRAIIIMYTYLDSRVYSLNKKFTLGTLEAQYNSSGQIKTTLVYELTRNQNPLSSLDMRPGSRLSRSFGVYPAHIQYSCSCSLTIEGQYRNQEHTFLCGCVRVQGDLLFIHDKDAVVLGGDAWHRMFTGHLSLIVTAGKDRVRDSERQKKERERESSLTATTQQLKHGQRAEDRETFLHHSFTKTKLPVETAVQRLRMSTYSHHKPGAVGDSKRQHNVPSVRWGKKAVAESSPFQNKRTYRVHKTEKWPIFQNAVPRPVKAKWTVWERLPLPAFFLLSFSLLSLSSSCSLLPSSQRLTDKTKILNPQKLWI